VKVVLNGPYIGMWMCNEREITPTESETSTAKNSPDVSENETEVRLSPLYHRVKVVLNGPYIGMHSISYAFGLIMFDLASY
jgi:hypothetical protein